MNPSDFPLFADENIHPDVVAYLRESGFDITSIAERGEFGVTDEYILLKASEGGRIVLTHDSDFGGLALFGTNFVGIIYLRPGHIRPEFTIQILKAIFERDLEVSPPFLLVAERRTSDTVKIRIRQF
ncbi:MAG: DUF5615 family PIN-like protein [Anaerolineae bacterium]|nr:DUF5615 family PIN-like protein [Anaerolineae bacterium]MBT7190356.1 DUF5615 family PIN-like protein [Anaerolineae bacterium]